ncbi:2',3'-cyclic-nucleotide 3'-phosphodiesterase, partial [Tremellales sp. Uapishka_1]
MPSTAPSLKAYALWLTPSPAERPALDSLIHSLSTHEPLSSPFPAHITLLHPLSLEIPLPALIARLEQTVASTPPLKLELQPAQSGDKYYQCVLSAVKPHNGLASLRTACEQEFGIHDLPPYFPHLSLLYGDLSSERRDEIAAMVKKEYDLPTRVAVQEVQIARCVGTAAEWEVVASVPLKKEG